MIKIYDQQAILSIFMHLVILNLSSTKVKQNLKTFY